ncbi:kinase-like domain-containing protein [Annulohypoxylon maeteangense]|uniref:kinase-like domain-containing protein n=1 Tax=Annulohypoxylon maeteangense TaxID=1927788 RepID=UPI0020084751|nr:kinase-like domain-containing protein [Annulohypoxylon maeteangense]KAI0890749.1 kinase-like domain-containing protein [Annulohypoxylon maeteangense]
MAEKVLPTVPEEVTASWLTEVLGTKVKSINVTKTMPGTASKICVTVEYEDANSDKTRPTDLCVKGGFNPAFIEQLPWVVMIYQREVEFFNQVAPTLDHMELPKSWWAGQNAKQGIVIMDDLASQGCQFGDPTETWPVSRVRAGLEQLAALHAKTWNVKPEDYPWLTSDYDQAILTLMKTYDAVVKSEGRPVIHEYLKDQERITAVLKKHYGSRNPKFRCLLHGDAHAGNTYLDKGAPRFLDWQMIHIGSSFHDVSYFIASALTIEDRRAHEFELLDHYLATIAKYGTPTFSSKDEDVLAEYKKSFLVGIGWIMCPYEMQPKECVHAMAVRHAAALDDHKVIEFVESLPAIE